MDGLVNGGLVGNAVKRLIWYQVGIDAATWIERPNGKSFGVDLMIGGYEVPGISRDAALF